MLKIEIKKDLEKLLKELGEVKSKQLPFALSKTVNEIAVEAKSIIKKEFERELTIRNKSLLNKGIQINFSNRKQFPYIEAAVGILEGFDFLADHVTGKQRTSLGSSGKAIPNLQEIKRTASGKMSNAMRPKQLLERKNVFKMETRRGTVIAKRVGKSKYPVKILYGFKKNVNIFERVEFFSAVDNLAGKRFDQLLGKNLAAALKSAK